MKILGISGSLRKASYNTSLLRAAVSLVPDGVDVLLADISEIPVYNEDVRALGFPAAVEKFREDIRAADALLFVTPEYNYSVPGVLKNAIDWASRPPDQPFSGKPTGIMGASMSAGGTLRAQYHLRQVGVYLNLHFLNQPEVMVAAAQTRFDDQGKLTDDSTREHVRKFLAAFAGFVKAQQA
jgi:chromate reductase